MRRSASSKRRYHDIAATWAMIRRTGMRAYVSGYNRHTRTVLVSAMEYTMAEAQAHWNDFVRHANAES